MVTYLINTPIINGGGGGGLPQHVGKLNLSNGIQYLLSFEGNKLPDGAFAGLTNAVSAELDDEITEIGEYAFQGCTSLTSVSMSNSLTVIGKNAFYNCIKLSSVTIPDSVTNIGSGAFYYTPIESVVIPDGITAISSDTFTMCTNLTSVTLPTSVTTLNGCFRRTKLTWDSVPSHVTKIQGACFGECYYIPSFTCHDGITEVGSFGGCSAMKFFVFPSGIKKIVPYMFQNCSALSSITMPDVEEIGDSAFYMNTNLKTFDFTKIKKIGSDSFYRPGFTNITFGPDLTYIGKNAFTDNYNISAVTFLGTSQPSTIGTTCFKNFKSTGTLYLPNGVRSDFSTIISRLPQNWTVLDATTLTPTDSKYVKYFNNGQCVHIDFFPTGEINNVVMTTFDSLEIGSGITSIGNQAFQNKSFATIVIPDSVTSIGTASFLGNTNLTSVTFGPNVTLIDSAAFYGCTSLSSITTPATTAPTLGQSVFESISSTGTLHLPNSERAGWEDFISELPSTWTVDCIEPFVKVYRGDSTNQTYKYSDGIVPNAAFSGDTHITKIETSGITAIGNDAFRACSFLDEVVIDDELTTIGNNTFRSCSRLQVVEMNDNSTSLEGLITLGECAFCGCDLTGEFNAPNVTTIGQTALQNNSHLESVVLPKVQTLNYRDFYNDTSLTSVTLEDVTTIGNNVFENCTSLSNITIPSGVTSIGKGAFSRCRSLSNITSNATVAPTLGDSSVFYNLPSTGTLTYPNGSDYSTWYDKLPSGWNPNQSPDPGGDLEDDAG